MGEHASPSAENAAPPAASEPAEHVAAEPDPALVAQLAAMGFEVEAATRALHAAHGNVMLATEHLLSGGEPVGDEEQGESLLDGNAAMDEDDPMARALNGLPQEIGSVVAAAGSEPQAMLQGLRDSPAFTLVRLLVSRQPNLLQPLVHAIVQQSPEFGQAMMQNQEAFAALMNEPLSDSSVQAAVQFMEQTDDRPEGEQNDEMDQQQGLSAQELAAQTQDVQITPAERDAVERLVTLGFAWPMCLQAFIACDRDENLAANFLFQE